MKRPTAEETTQEMKPRRTDGTGGSGTSRCKSCNALVVWRLTPAARWTPCNPDGSTHWQTCPNAGSHKQPHIGPRPRDVTPAPTLPPLARNND